MINTFLAAALALLSFPVAQQEPIGATEVEAGWLSQYDPNLMWATAWQQYEWGKIDDLTIYDGFIATRECQVGREGWLSINGGEWLFVVAVDCSGHASTTQWMERDNIIAEISHSLAVDYGVVGQGGVWGEIAWIE